MTRTSTTGEEVMRSFVQHEHHDLAAGIEHIHATACELASLPADRMSGRVLEVSHWIDARPEAAHALGGDLAPAAGRPPRRTRRGWPGSSGSTTARSRAGPRPWRPTGSA